MLEHLQRQFFHQIKKPLWGESRERTHLTQRGRGPDRAFHHFAQKEITPGQQITPDEALELYHRQYWYRLLSSIEEDFPLLQRYLGSSSFWNLIEDYLADVNSHSYTLRHLGQHLEDYLRQHSPAGLEPSGVRHEQALDLTRFEYSLMRAFEAGQLPPPSSEDYLQEALILQPHVQLLTTHWAVEDYQGDEAPEKSGETSNSALAQELGDAPGTQQGPPLLPAAESPYLLIWRNPKHRLRLLRIPEAQYRILSAFMDPCGLEAALTSAGITEAAEITPAFERIQSLKLLGTSSLQT